MTAVPASPRITELRELFRYLSDFRATYELTGMEEIQTPLGNVWSIWDLEYLFEVAQERLTPRQKQVITLCLVNGVKESDAAEMLGVAETNPVMMYASLGIQRLLDMIDGGELDRFNKPRLRPEDEAERQLSTLHELADFVKSKVVIANDCWLFPNRGRQEPRLLLRSPRTYTGYRAITPMQVMWMAHVGPVPPGCHVAHSTKIKRVSISCSNPQHGDLIQSAARKAEVQRQAERYIRSLGRSAA